jgi:hypothetical protein
MVHEIRKWGRKNLPGVRMTTEPVIHPQHYNRADLLIQGMTERPLAVDVTTNMDHALSHRARAMQGPGRVAQASEQRKKNTYTNLCEAVGYTFVPVALEFHGTFGPSAIDFLRTLARRVTLDRARFIKVLRELVFNLIVGARKAAIRSVLQRAKTMMLL